MTFANAVSNSTRPIGVTVTSILFLVASAFWVGIGAGAFFTGLEAELDGLSPVVVLPYGGALGLLPKYFLEFGGALLMMGIIGVLCGWWLWKAKVSGAYLGIPLLIAGIAVAIGLLLAYPLVIVYEFAGLILTGNVFLLLLLLTGLRFLRR